MTDVVVQDKDVVVEVEQPTVPTTASPPKIGLVEINQSIARGSIWTTGHGAPAVPGGQNGDMYLDIDTGDIYQWAGSWQFQGTFAPATLTPAEILAALLTVDGDGSGLDADLLDGEHGSYYAKQSDMTTETTRNDDQDFQIAQNSGDIAGNIAAVANLNATKAPIASPIFTGDPKAPTPSPGDNDTSIATTAFVTAAVTAGTLPADILAKLLTVDGTGSGLDADLLDGQSGGYYLDLLNATGILPAARFNDTSHGVRGGGNLHALATDAIAGFILDAPSDSFVYGRKNGGWSTVIGGATTDDNPPAGPLQDGQLWWKSSTGVLYLWYDDGNTQQWVQVSASPQIVDNNYVRKTADEENCIVNPSMWVSQEVAGAAVTANGAYPVDQWQIGLVTTGAISAQRVVTPVGASSPSPFRLRLTVTTADASIAAGEYCVISQAIEGVRIAKLKYGTAVARQAVLRFGFKGPAGTYSIRLINGATNRSYVAQFTITAGQANIDTAQSIVIPGDVTGTWTADNTLGLTLAFVLTSGSTFVGVQGWQAGNILAGPGQSNGLGVVNNVFEIWDVGLHADGDFTGVAPPYVVPDYDDALRDCQRYWQAAQPTQRFWATAANQVAGSSFPFPVSMRTTPTSSMVNNGVSNNVTSVTLTTITADAARVQIQAAGTGDTYSLAANFTLNARM